jgi:hypothetical protein
MEWVSAFDRKEVGRRTNTTSPFAGGMADEKSWLNGHVPVYYELERPWTVMRARDPTFLKFPTQWSILTRCRSVYRRAILIAGCTRWVVPPRIS